jgi:hypothetical protein
VTQRKGTGCGCRAPARRVAKISATSGITRAFSRRGSANPHGLLWRNRHPQTGQNRREKHADGAQSRKSLRVSASAASQMHVELTPSENGVTEGASVTSETWPAARRPPPAAAAGALRAGAPGAGARRGQRVSPARQHACRHFLGGDRIADVVAPGPVDVQLPHAHAFLAEPELFHDPP